jgi:cytochrome c
MRIPMRPLVVAMLVGSLSHVTFATEEKYGTPQEAEAMVRSAVSHIRAVGAEKAYADFTNKAPGFFDRDLYVTVHDLRGRVLAHGGNAHMVGKDLLEMRDADGKPFVKERMELARTKGKFWHDYKFTDQVTQTVLPKSTYCERDEATVVCVGIYKR